MPLAQPQHAFCIRKRVDFRRGMHLVKYERRKARPEVAEGEAVLKEALPLAEALDDVAMDARSDPDSCEISRFSGL